MLRAYAPRAARLGLPAGHRSPMATYAQVAERLAAAGRQPDDAREVDEADLARVHDGAYLADPDRTVAAIAAGLFAVAETLGARRTTC